MERLISAILIQMVKDWKKSKHQSEIKVFLRSRWFTELTEALDLDPRAIRTKLENGDLQPVSLRAPYR